MTKILRLDYLEQIKESFKSSKIVVLIGPRQIGKTSLAKEYGNIHKEKFKQVHFFDLEDPTDFTLLENSKLTLESLEGLLIIDEVQRRPEMFPYLRVKSDSLQKGSRILLLGSASRDLIEKSGETLAGRVSYIEIKSLNIFESQNSEKLFFRGGFPLSFLAKSEQLSYEWRKNYLISFVERDLKYLGVDLPPQTTRRFMEMLCAYHGGIFNASEIGKALGFSHTSARKYLDVLGSSFIIRLLRPWSENISQRQVKLPKMYFRDTGIIFHFLSLRNKLEISRSPKIGHFWEGFALEETMKYFKMDSHDCYFWSIHQGAEIDLLWMNHGKKIGFEFKYSDSPKVTASMMSAIDILKLDKLYIVYPGDKEAVLGKKIELLSMDTFLKKEKNQKSP
ncbi:MAG: ATP-binding protein [Bacteriovoracaceae bacterium]|nr:ATP-binding protein [Bacteriovoracaceae bacterium]